MAERFDSWKGFVDAGFTSAEDGALRLGDTVASCAVTKEGDGLRVKFSGGVSGYEDIAFSLPTEVGDFYEWVARIAYGTFGASENWNRFREKLGGMMNRDLEQMITIGIDHLDEIETDGASSSRDVEDTDIEDEVVEEAARDELAEDGVRRATNEVWSSCLREIVKKELAGEWRKLSDAAQAQDIERSHAVMESVNRLKAMDGKIAALAEEWKALRLSEPFWGKGSDNMPNGLRAGDCRSKEDVASPLRRPQSGGPAKQESPSKPKAPIPTPESRGALGFAVMFEDGERIAEAKASTTFAKAIEKIGAERVAALGLQMAGDPLVTRNRTEIKKMPMMVQPIADGWFVKTHSNTYTKMEYLRRIAAALDVSFKFEQFRREPVIAQVKKHGRSRPSKKPSRPQVKFQIGRVVKWAFPRIFEKGRITEDEIVLFLSGESRRRFGTRGYPVLKVSIGGKDDCIVNGQRRYYSDIRLVYEDHTYLLTSQFVTANAEPILAWLESKGFSREDLNRIGCGEETIVGLFPDETTFAHDPVVDADRHPSKKDVQKDSPAFALTSDSPQPTLFDSVPVASAHPEKDGSVSAPKDILAADVKVALRREMKRHSYVPRTLAAGLGFPYRLVKSWYKGRGVIKPDEYAALCRHMGIAKL